MFSESGQASMANMNIEVISALIIGLIYFKMIVKLLKKTGVCVLISGLLIYTNAVITDLSYCYICKF